MPVAEIPFCDGVFNAIDLLKVTGSQRWVSAGQFEMPIVVMTPSGSGFTAVFTIRIPLTAG